MSFAPEPTNFLRDSLSAIYRLNLHIWTQPLPQFYNLVRKATQSINTPGTPTPHRTVFDVRADTNVYTFEYHEMYHVCTHGTYVLYKIYHLDDGDSVGLDERVWAHGCGHVASFRVQLFARAKYFVWTYDMTYTCMRILLTLVNIVPKSRLYWSRSSLDHTSFASSLWRTQSESQRNTLCILISKYVHMYMSISGSWSLYTLCTRMSDHRSKIQNRCKYFVVTIREESAVCRAEGSRK